MRPFLVLVARTLSLIFLLTASSAVGADFPLYDDDPRIRSSVNYLLSCQNPDGGFGEIPGNSSALLVTADVAMALAQTSDINLAIRDGKTILDYLIDKRPPASNVSTGDLGRYLMGVVAAGGNPHDFAESGYVDILKYRSRQLTEIDPSEEAYALLGLIAVRELESIEARTYVRDLKSRQFDSGGWGKNSSLPDTDTTGLVLCALIGSGEDVNATWMKKALTWLGSVQKDDGGFSGCLSSPDGSCSPSTGLAVMAILAMGQRPVEEPWRIGDANPVNFLLSCQQPNGSIWLKPDAPGPLISGYTAFGLISLTGGWLPTARLAPPSPVISVHKTANVSLALPGDTILYTIRVNNTGNRTLSDVVADDNLTKHQEYIGFLDPGKNHTFTTEYTVKRVDIGKPIVNNVTARGTYDGVVYQGFDTESVDTVYNPNIAVNKTANVTEVDKAGSIILYTIWVNNTGNTILRDIVADDSLTKLKEDIGSLDPGKNHSFTTTYTVKAADLGKPIINKVTASGKDPEGKSHENSSIVTVETESPDIVLMQLMVFNDGALVFNKTVDVVGVNPTSWDAIQQSGASYEYTDWGGGLGIFIDRLAGVGEPGWGPSFWIDGKFSEWGASNWHIHEGEIDQWIGPNSDSYSAKILRVDDATPASVAKGESFRVKITEETVYWGIPAGTPSRGATVTVGFDKYITNSEGLTPEITLNRDAYYGIYAVKPKHLATYWLGHISPIDGISTIKCGAGGPLISDLTGEKPPTNPNIEVKKTANLTEASTGDVIGYTIWVNNTGDTSLSDVVARDDLTGKEMKWAALKAGEKKSFITEYTVKTADLGKPVVNRVTVRGKDPEGKSHENSSTALVKTPSIPVTIHKSASPKGGLPLTEISFFIAVTNTEDDDLHAVSVVDHLPPGLVYASDNRSGLLSGNEITWEIGDLGRGESDFIELAAEIEEGAFGILTNEVNVAAIDETGKEVTHSSSEDVIALETETLDFGDAPESYSTLLAGNGARHVIIPNFCLGYIIDGEPEAWASSDALGDNIHDLNDEDGVSITDLLLIPGATSTIDVHASDDGGYLNAWIDFGADGSWAEGLDQIFVDRPLNKGSNSLTFFIPPEAKEDSETFARFRFSTEKGLSFAGLALDGEVEDYRLNIGKNPRVVVSKTADKTEVKRGDDINYTIRIDNTLGMPLHNVVVRDVFNKSVEFVSASPAPDSDGIWRFPEVGVGGMTINLTVKVPKVRDMAFNMDQEVTGVGFMNIANDYDTSLESYAIENCVYVTSDETGDMVFRDCESVAISGDPGTKLSTREHGSGSYQGEERLRVRTENRSISMDKNMSAAYSPTAFALYNNRTIDYSSKWMEGAWAKNWATGSSMSEYYRYATSIDRESRFDIDKNGTSMEFDTSFEGQGHMGTILTSGQHATPSVEFREDYSGSFNIYQRTDEYGSGTISEKTTQGTGFVSVDKRIKESQRSYEYGTGNYSSEEIIGSSSNYIAKNISVEHRPSSFKVGGEPYSNQSLKWNEGISSKTPDTSFIGEEYTGIDHMEKETVARGLNEMETEAEFSGQARYRTVLQDDIDLVALRGAIDIDQVYIGEYSLRRHILIEGVSRVDHPHLAVNKSGELYYGDESVLARYRITLENDGNQSLDSIYIEDFFPPHAVYINSTARPSELTASSANWTLTHLSIGDRAVIDLWLDVTNYAGDELVNRVAASGAYNETWVTAFNFTVLDVDWLAYNLQRTLAVSKSAELSQDQPDVVRYSLTIQNLKGSDRVLRITDPLPQGMEFLEASVPPSSDEHGVLTWNQIELGPFQTKTIFYDAKALWPGTFVTWAEVDVGAVNGTSVPTQYAMAIIDVGVSDGERSAEVWQPPDWGFNLTCYDCDLEATKPICGEKE
ncbi:MAG: prenyltransferase/squalene oxidase repeat-containing protein [Euryarchaeota archaeon]|nr:prenyltransferase/squalene oxidase repeat-containing protein [Euryarchaeota archaeon]